MMKIRIHASLRTVIALLAIPFLTAVAAASGLKWEKTETSLALRDGERVVWRFSAGPEAGKPYFHPVCLPDGTVATDHGPADHKWHLGLWFTFNKVNGVNFWAESDGRIWGPGRVKVEKVAFETKDDFSATISLMMTYLVEPNKLLLTEQRRYHVAPPGERVNAISVHHRFTAAEDAVINEATYGGLAYRPAPALMRWRWLLAEPFAGQAPWNFPEQFPVRWQKKFLLKPPAKWMALVEQGAGETRGVGLLDHPDNPRYPTCWGGLAFNANHWATGDLPLAKGQSVELRYRVLFFSRQTPVSFLEEQHALFVKQPE